MTVFQNGALYYDVLYAGKPHKTEVEHFLSVAGVSSPRAHFSRILELGIGTGRHACLLADLGFVVHGIELSESMLLQLPERPDVVGHLGDARSCRLNEQFDAVFSFFHVASYQAQDQDIVGFFSTARAHLPLGGKFVFDCWYSPGVISQRPEPRTISATQSGQTVTRHSRVTEDVDKSLVFVLQEFVVSAGPGETEQRFSEEHVMRHFTSAEIRLLAQATGFEISSVVDPDSGNAPTRATWAATYCLDAV